LPRTVSLSSLEHSSRMSPPTALSQLPPRAPVPRELLGHTRLPRLFAMAAVEWAWIAVFQVGLHQVPVAAPLFVLLLAGRFHAFGVILHEAVHMPLSRKGPGLWLLECLVGYPIATTWNAMRYHHLRHHLHEGTAQDGYHRPPPGPRWQAVRLWLMLSFVVPLWMVRGPVGLLAWAVPAVRPLYGRLFLLDRSGDNLMHREELLACARAELGQVLCHLGVLALAWRWPWAVGLGYALPVMGASALSAYRLLAEHTSESGQDRMLQGTLRSTADHGQGWLGWLMLAPRNVGCHIVHHLHPQVALQHLPRLRTWYQHRYPGHYPPSRRF
jgi:fatty acid desaturase